MAKPKTSREPEYLGIDDVAALLFVDERTIRNWINSKGMPSMKDERARRFNWFEVLPWYVKMRNQEDGNRRNSPVMVRQEWPGVDAAELKESLDAANLRRTIAEADLRELDLAQRRGQVVAIADVSKTIADLAKNLQIEILGFPTNIVGQIFGMKDRSQLFAALTQSARQLCSRLAVVGAPPVDPETPDA
jgi:phage terminase Nu1 subunit (DNA packaging protein)